MQANLKLMTAAAIIALWSSALAQGQQEHQEHHPGGAPTQAQPAQPSQPAPNQPSAQGFPPAAGQPSDQPSPPNAGQPPAGMPMGQMMERMPEQCRAIMQNMPQNCMSMMQGMMRGDARQGGMMGGGMMGGMMGRGMMGGGMQAPASASAASKAYMEVADKMYGPIMEGLQADDPDIAFVRAMIAQRQGAIELAKVRLQYGKDEQTHKWADDTIQRQQAEIDEMQAWLKKQVK
jgi:uncharacterized protein (DUF305 family)